MAWKVTLIAGRTTRQGTSLNRGKADATYIEVTGAIELSEADLAALGLRAGAPVLARSRHGMAQLRCKAAKPGELPPGLAFMAYGPPSSLLMSGDTQGTGMPDSKGVEIELEPVPGGATAGPPRAEWEESADG